MQLEEDDLCKVHSGSYHVLRHCGQDYRELLTDNLHREPCEAVVSKYQMHFG